MKKFWFTKQSPGVLPDGAKGVWVFANDEARALELKEGDLVCIYEVWQDPDSRETGGGKAIVAISKVRRKLTKPEGRGKWRRVAYMDVVAKKGKIPYSKVLSILGTGNIRDRRYTLLPIDKHQFNRIAKSFKDFTTNIYGKRSHNKTAPVKKPVKSASSGISLQIGAIYRRSKIHTIFGGQRQGGISTSRKYPFVLLFSGGTGSKYGCNDRWEGEVFFYTGEGQAGDMELTKGNVAIKDAEASQKELHLFEYVSRGIVKYCGQMLYQGYHIESGTDRNGEIRKLIIFELLPLVKTKEAPDAPIPAEDLNLTLDELRKRALKTTSVTADYESHRQNVYARSRHIRSYVLRRANGICEGCGEVAPFVTGDGRPYLEPHHIRSRADGGPDHPAWVAGVCPNCHAKAHFSSERIIFNNKLIQMVREKEKERTE